MIIINSVVRIEALAQGITLWKIMTLSCDFGPSTALLVIHMIKYLITSFFQTGYSQRKVNVAFVITTKDALQNSTQFKDTFIIFSRTVQFCFAGSLFTKSIVPL